MFFGNPSYLFALAGLLVPLAIHLWSKKEGKVIKVGSIEYFSEEDAKKSSSIRLNELWLLILRMLLLGTLTFILAQLYFKLPITDSSKALFIDPELRDSEKTSQLIDSLQETYDVHWFMLGFSSIEETLDTTKAHPPYWQLLKMLDNYPAQEMVVVSQSKLTQLFGSRPEINRPISWITINEPGKSEFVAEAIHTDNGYAVINGISTPTSTRFNKVKWPKLDVTDNGQLIQDTLRVAFQVDQSFEKDSIFIKAALETIQNYTQWPVAIVTNVNNANGLIWLSDQPVEKEVDYLLVWHTDTLAAELIQYTPNPKTYHLTHHLTQKDIVDQDFVTTFFQTLRPHISNYQNVTTNHDLRQLDERQLMPVIQQNKVIDNTLGSPLNNYLWIVLIIIFAGERTLSFIRNQ